MITDLTFSDWEHYTDGDGTPCVLDWSSAAAMRGRPAYPYIEALRLALLERTALNGDYDVAAALPGPMRDCHFPTAWGRAVMGGLIKALRRQNDMLYSTGTTRLEWFRPASVSTLHNVTAPLSESLAGEFLVSSESPSAEMWLASLETQLDDAGIVDSAFRTWWMSHDVGYFGDVVPVDVSDNTVWRSAEVIRCCRLILSRFTRALLRTHWPIATAHPLVSGAAAEYRVVDDMPWANLVAAFNAEPWDDIAGSALDSWEGTAAHIAAGQGNAEYISQSLTDPAIFRSRVTCVWNLPAGADLEFVGTTTLRDEAGTWRLPRPHFMLDADLPGITADISSYGTPYGVCASFGSLSAGPGLQAFTYGDFGDNSLPDPAGDGESYEGWVAPELGVLLNFDVSGGFTFR